MEQKQQEFLSVRESLEAAPPGIFQTAEDNRASEDGQEALHLLIRTPLVYPGGGKISIYLRIQRQGYLLTDRGNTMAMLGRYLSSDTEDEERWDPAVQKICEGLGIRMQGREWTVQAGKTEDVGKAAMMLAQGLLRAAIMAPVFKITRDARRGNG